MEAELPKENVEYGVLGGGCFVKKSHVELFMKLDRSVYKQGQIIHPYVECSVEAGFDFPMSSLLTLTYTSF